MKGLDRQWHEKHRMPERPTDDQRVAWHREHAKVCGCRPIPRGVLELMRAKQAARRGAARSTSRRFRPKG